MFCDESVALGRSSAGGRGTCTICFAVPPKRPSCGWTSRRRRSAPLRRNDPFDQKGTEWTRRKKTTFARTGEHAPRPAGFL